MDVESTSWHVFDRAMASHAALSVSLISSRRSPRARGKFPPSFYCHPSLASKVRVR